MAVSRSNPNTMRLSWQEIRANAARFSREWADAKYERGETQTFYNEFFSAFGVSRRRVATFEEPIKKLGDKQGFIDLFWKGLLLVEQKSAGRNLTKAKEQALEYFPNLKDYELPRFVLVSDFQTFELYDLEERTEKKFPLSDFHKHVEAFGFILGIQKRTFKDQDPVNIKASELMGKLHDALKDSGYEGHNLERFLVRLIFCLFADDTGIFEPRDIFLDLIESRSREDGVDVGERLSALFEVLNTAPERRQKALDEDLARFPYINGDLFSERLAIPSFNRAMRNLLIEACEFSWDAISPAIFGSLFQSVMNEEERRKQGAHYTSEKSILKLIEPLFLSDLRQEFEKIRSRKDNGRANALRAFQAKLGELTFFDPACGCGNFLIVSYRELRSLELELIKELNHAGQLLLDVSTWSVVNVNQFFGIEVDEFPARIAETAMWMMDHIMNNRVTIELGPSFLRIPLTRGATIKVGNSLSIRWVEVLPPNRCSYILGNPPFIGHQWRTAAQQADMAWVWGRSGQVNRLDYVTCWFKKALDYAAENREIRIGFVSTNSITQGEQAGILWPVVFASGMSIFFAHRTFQWNSEARGKAAVHCVIIGLSFGQPEKRTIFEYEHVRSEPHASEVSTINGYLIDGPQYAVPARTQPREGLLRMHKGSQPTDGARIKRASGGYDTFSNLILDAEDKEELLSADPNAEKWLKPFVGGDELISNKWRWCLWLKHANPSEVKASKPVMERLERVRIGRLQSPTESVRQLAKYPMLFTQDRQPDIDYLAVPEVSSEHREYIPMSMLPPSVIASNKLQIIPAAPMHYFGILTSAMHMAWMRTVAGRLESRYSYAPSVYNSFPWPELDSSKQDKITKLAENIIAVRGEFTDSALEDLYDIDSMPAKLRRAHADLDKAVDQLYRKQPFQFERERVEHLFQLYEQNSQPLTTRPRKMRTRRNSN